MSEEIEKQIQEEGATEGGRVPFEIINDMVDELHYEVVVLENMTTIAVASYKGFNVGTGEAACVDKVNYREAIGNKVAMDRARAKATDTLWMLEGWRKHMNMLGE